MAKTVSIPPWASLSFIYRNQEDTPHGIVLVATAIRVPAESQWRRKQKQQEWACRVVPGRKKHEMPEDGQKWMLAFVLGSGW